MDMNVAKKHCYHEDNEPFIALLSCKHYNNHEYVKRSYSIVENMLQLYLFALKIPFLYPEHNIMKI